MRKNRPLSGRTNGSDSTISRTRSRSDNLELSERGKKSSKPRKLDHQTSRDFTDGLVADTLQVRGGVRESARSQHVNGKTGALKGQAQSSKKSSMRAE